MNPEVVVPPPAGPRRNLSVVAVTTALLLLGSLPTGRGQGTPSTVTGSVNVDFPPGAKTWTALPLTRPAEFVGRIQSIAGPKITVVPSPNWGPKQFNYSASAGQHKHYYLLVGRPDPVTLPGTLAFTQGTSVVTGVGTSFTGALKGDAVVLGGRTYLVTKVASATSLSLDRVYAGASAGGVPATFIHAPLEGRAYAIIKSKANAVLINPAGDDLGALAPGTSVSLVPYWTLGTVFPPGDENRSFIAKGPASKGTKIQVPPPAGEPGELATYYFANGAWRQSGHSVEESHDDDILAPDAHFTVKSPAGIPTHLRLTGKVCAQRQCLPLVVDSQVPVTNALGLLRPVPVNLHTLGLLANHAFVKGTPDGLGDRITWQAGAGSDGLPVVQSFYLDKKGWHQVGAADPVPDIGETIYLVPGRGFRITKSPQATGDVFWSNPPGYSQSAGE